MNEIYRREKVYKCFKSKDTKPKYFEPWFLPNCFSLQFRIFVLLFAGFLWIKAQLNVTSFNEFCQQNIQQYIINYDVVIAYAIVGIFHYFTVDKMNSTQTEVMSFLWIYAIVYLQNASNVLWVLLLLTGQPFETVAQKLAGNGLQSWVIFLPIAWEFTYVRQKSFKYLIGAPIIVFLGVILPILCIHPEYKSEHIPLSVYVLLFVGGCIGITWVYFVFWLASYENERKICMIYDYPFKDDILCMKFRNKDFRIPDQNTMAIEFETLKVVDSHPFDDSF